MNKKNALLTLWTSLLLLLGMTTSCAEGDGGCNKPGVHSNIEDTWEMTKMEVTIAGQKTVYNHQTLKKMGVRNWTFTKDDKLQNLCDEQGRVSQHATKYLVFDKTLTVQSPADIKPIGAEVLNFSITKLCPLYLRLYTKMGEGDAKKEWYMEFSRVK